MAALTQPPARRPRTQRGLTYAEVLLSVVLLAILLVPALQALNTGIAGITSASGLATRQLSLRSKMDEVLGKPYGQLYAETSVVGGNTTSSVSAAFSDAAGGPGRRVVVLYRFNASTNVLSATDTGLLYVSVYDEAEGSANALNTLVGRWW